MFLGFSLITLSYVVLVVLGIWLLTNREMGVVRVFVMPFLIWYGAAIYIGSSSMLGYPTGSLMKDGTIIVSVRIVEPRQNVEGGMYFWGIPLEKMTDKTCVPRSFYLPYDPESHKQLMNKKNDKEGVLVWRRNRVKLGRVKKKDGMESVGTFEILNPSKILTKEE